MTDMELAEEIGKACTEARADMFVSWLLERLIQDPFTRPKVKQDAAIAIAALRSGPERPPSGEMVMVPRDAWEGFVRMLQKHQGHKDRGDITPQRILELARAMLSAAEAEGRKS